MVSPIPAFIAKDLPQKEAHLLSRSVGPSPTLIVPREGRAVELLKTVSKVQQMEEVQNDNYLAEGEEEPVKNSMFWLYRSFPHIG